MTTVLVTGGRGKTGREVMGMLAGRPDVAVRAGSRDPGTLPADGSEPVRFEWEEPDTWKPAARGAEVAYLVRPEIEDAPERISAFLAAAESVENVVLISEQGAGGLSSSSWERRVEDSVRQADAWTVLRCSVFHQILIDEDYVLAPIRDEDAFEWPSAGSAISFVDTRDIAEIVVESLLGRDHAGQTYTLTGSEALTFDQVAERLTSALGRPIRYGEQPISDCLAGFFGAGAPPTWLSRYYEGVMERICAGVFAELTDAVEKVCGREPRSIDAFIEEHVAMWRPLTPASR